MANFKIIEEIEEINISCCYYGNYIPEINLRDHRKILYYRDTGYKQKIDYFMKNKDKYLFVMDNNWVNVIVIDKEFALLNMEQIYEDFLYPDESRKKLCRFIKYHLIKEKLYVEN